jgi:site-specific DNA-methyltransferase (adenine-specific)
VEEIKHLNKIILGDSLELMKELPDNSIDLLLTDPPYELDTSGGGKSNIMSIGKLCNSDIQNISSISKGFDYEAYFSEWNRVLKKFNAFIFCSNSQISKLMSIGEGLGYITTLLVWHKTNAAPFANGVWRSNLEFIVHIREKGATFQGSAREKSKIYTSPTERSKYSHPTEKPIELVIKLLKIGANKGDIVLDSFSGSGTTVNACINLGMNYIAYEIDEKFYNISKDREQRALGNVGLFG